MAFFNSAVCVLQTLVIALGAGLGIWGVINLMEGYGNDNPGAKSQGMKQLMAVGVPLFFLVKRGGNVSLAALTMIGVMLPFFFLAMYEKDGMPLEVILDHFFEAKFRRPKERPYVTNNYYPVLIRQYVAEKEVDEIVLHEERKAKGKRHAESSKVSQQKRP